MLSTSASWNRDASRANTWVMDLTDAEVIEAARDAPAAFGELFERHFDSVHRFCARRVGLSRAEDLAGETFRRAFEHRDRYNAEQTSALPWLLGIAMNLVRSELRSSAALDRVHLRLASMAGTATADAVSDALAARDTHEELVAVARLIATLPEDDVEALLLHVWDGLSYSEVAATLGIPIGTVRSRLSRLRRRLESMLAESNRCHGLGTGMGGR
jgi:RNA polymerase sigma factor (sigma-70 family)